MNIPNMYYRRYRNTLQAMNQIIDGLDDEGRDDREMLSREEEIAKRQLQKACETFLDETGRLIEIIKENQ